MGINLSTRYVKLAILCMVFFTLLFGCKDKDDSDVSSHIVYNTVEQHNFSEEYIAFRDLVFHLTPEQINLPVKSEQVLALTMEYWVEEDVVTLVCVADGSTSIYFSNGGGIIGAGECDAVRTVSLEYLLASKDFLRHFKPTDLYPLPSQQYVRFHIIQSTNIYTAEATEVSLTNRNHPLAPLYYKAHEVITAIRENEPK